MRAILPKYLLMFLMLLACPIAIGHTAEPPAVTPPTITVEADGKVTAIPDLALLTLEVESRAPQAETASQANAQQSDALLKALKPALGPEDQVKTLGYRLSRVYSPKDKTSPPEVKGYAALHRFQVKLKGTARLGPIIDLVLKNGASGVNGPVWEHSRSEELQRQAAVAALERARRLAEALAQSQGLKITGVEKISTGLHSRPFMAAGTYQAARPGAPSTPIEVGEEEIRASVQVVFQVKP